VSPTTGKSDADLFMGTSSHELPLSVLECGTGAQSYIMSHRGQADTHMHACVSKQASKRCIVLNNSIYLQKLLQVCVMDKSH